MKTIILLLLCGTCLFSYGQETPSTLDKVITFPDKIFGALNKKTEAIESKLDKQTAKYLSKLQKQEMRQKKKLLQKDSTLAQELFADIESKYNQLKQVPQNVTKYTNVYSGHLDSLSTALGFLKQGNFSDITNNPQLEKALTQYKSLQGKFNQSEKIRTYLEERQQLLKEQFQRLGMVKELKKFREKVYYYQAQVKAYRDAFDDPHKLEAKLLEVLTKLPAFKDFFARHSQVAQPFPLAQSDDLNTVSTQGLQTRALLEQTLRDRFGNGAQATQLVQQNMQGAQSQLSELKDKAAQYTSGSLGSGGSSDDPMPDFKPNNQKTKSFRSRLELGTNLQTARGRTYFPITSDFGLSLGYKLNDRSTVGIGASYKMGWGRGWNNIRITHQGASVRSFLDYKLKGLFYLSGGYEQNYRSEFRTIEQLKKYNVWQRSGLVGLSKKYSVSKKFNGSLQLLWDFLSYQQVPRTQTLLWRIGYSLK